MSLVLLADEAPDPDVLANQRTDCFIRQREYEMRKNLNPALLELPPISQEPCSRWNKEYMDAYMAALKPTAPDAPLPGQVLPTDAVAPKGPQMFDPGDVESGTRGQPAPVIPGVVSQPMNMDKALGGGFMLIAVPAVAFLSLMWIFGGTD